MSNTQKSISHLLGTKFGRWTILEDLGNVNKTRMVKCLCDCGIEKEIGLSGLKKGTSKSCGCSYKSNAAKYVNKKYGRLQIISLVGVNNWKTIVRAKCECGSIKEYKLNSLLTGNTKSCGCYNKQRISETQFVHGLSYHPLMRVWGGMIQRCHNEKDDSYYNYGAKGVTVCEEWRNDFKSFYDWAIDNGWEKGLEIDKDKLSPYQPGLIYSPSYCCFLTRKENSEYKCSNVYIEFNNQNKTMMQWSKELNIPYQGLKMRIIRGWDKQKALITPFKVCKTNANSRIA